MADKYDTLKLTNQICFPLYAASRKIINRYTPFLEKLDLTYTQYITMMVLWEEKEVTAKQLGRSLCLASGTLTPLLKKMEAKGLLTRSRSSYDERNLVVKITQKGEQLRDKALEVPERMAECSSLDTEDRADLYRILYEILGEK